jgi:hypothetical protein
VTDEELVPFDLCAEPRYLIRWQGSSDPDRLDYAGFLNLIGRGPMSARQPCSLHPQQVIGADGCPRCREIRQYRNERGLNGAQWFDARWPLPLVGAKRVTHRCDDECACPEDGKPMVYAPASGEHACLDPECRYAHGGRVYRPGLGVDGQEGAEHV